MDLGLTKLKKIPEIDCSYNYGGLISVQFLASDKKDYTFEIIQRYRRSNITDRLTSGELLSNDRRAVGFVSC